MDVYTYDPARGEVHVAWRRSTTTWPTPTWTRFSISLPLSLAGRTIKVGFQAATDMSKNTNFFVDSVSLDVIACAP